MAATAKQALLLLPSLSSPVDRASVQAAYKATFEVLLPSLTPRAGSREITRLDVAIELASSSDSRSALFNEYQHLLEQLYTLICIVAAQHDIDLDFDGGLDIRVLVPAHGSLLSTAWRPSSFWPSTALYTVKSEAGIAISKSLLQRYDQAYHLTPKITQLPCGPSITASSFQPPNNSSTIHKSVAVGGTFDHLHIGHKLLLSATAFLPSPTPPSQPRKITIGITGDDLLINKKHASVLESWDIRQQRTADFVESILFATHADPASILRVERQDEPGPNGKVVRYIYAPKESEGESEVVVNYTLINDPYGPTVTDEDISALVISKETRAGGKAVNDKRGEKGWKALEVFEVDVLDARPEGSEEAGVEKEGFEEKISSTEIRRRLVEMERERREGKL